MSPDFDVFLSHNSKDKPAVRELAEALRARGLRVWLDEWELVPGRPWQEALEEIIETTRSSAVLVGKDGFGPWHDAEMRGCLAEFVDRRQPVIPVLLPGAPAEPKLPFFLRRFTWVDLRSGMTEEGLEKLQWGITGKRPNRSKTGMEPPVDPKTTGAITTSPAEEQPATAEVMPASLIRSDELVKQRIDTAKRILKEMQDLEQIHLQVLGGHLIEGTGADPRALVGAIQSVKASRVELRLLQAKTSVLKSIDRILELASDVVGVQPPGSSGYLKYKDGSLLIEKSSERAEWMQRRQGQMAEALRDFETLLQKAF